MKNAIRPLGKICEIVQSIGWDISYAYDDLVFAENSLFILKFNDDNPHKVYLYFNIDCIPSEQSFLKQQLISAGKIGLIDICYAGTFTLKQINETEEIKIEFR